VAKKANPLLPKLPRPSKPSPFHPKKPFAIAPRGPRHLHLGQHPLIVGVGPGEPPPGFVGAHTSREEWMVYWAIATHKNDPVNPRVPPFTGSRIGDWFYQAADAGGRVPGGSVTDYQVRTPTGMIGIRLDTERWHIFAGPNQQLKDLFIKTHVKSLQKVVTIYSQDFLRADPSEQAEALMKVVALALRGIEYNNPIRSGTAQRRRGRVAPT
jgi:hypothetical protein